MSAGMDDLPDLIELAGYVLGVAVFLGMRRHGFWAAWFAAAWAVAALVTAGTAVLVGGNLALLALSAPYLLAFIAITFAPLALLLPVLHGLLHWMSKRRGATP